MPRYSLTEIEAHCRKAARGAGYHWGEADDMGKAVRWLCANGVNGAEKCLDLLQQTDGTGTKFRPTPDVVAGKATGQVCGLAFGCALADRGEDTIIDVTYQANIIAPHITIGVLGNCISKNGLTALVHQFLDQDLPDNPQTLTDIVPELWAALNTYAHRTYVPATEESRAKGAG